MAIGNVQKTAIGLKHRRAVDESQFRSLNLSQVVSLVEKRFGGKTVQKFLETHKGKPDRNGILRWEYKTVAAFIRDMNERRERETRRRNGFR